MTAEALHGRQVFLWHYFDHDIGGRWRARPLLAIDGKLYAAMKISEAGIVTVAPPKNDLIAQAHQAVGREQLGKVAELFNSDESNPPPPTAAALTAERLEIDFTDPAGVVETVRRDLLDRIGAAARSEERRQTAPLSPVPEIGGIPIQLASVHACAFTAGPLDPSSILRQIADRSSALEAAAALRARPGGSIADAERPKLVANAMQGLGTALAASAATAHLLSQRLASPGDGSGKMIFYEAKPRLVIASAAFTASADGKRITPSFGIDLRRDMVRVVGAAAPVSLVRANLARGVLDAVIEDAPRGQTTVGVSRDQYGQRDGTWLAHSCPFTISPGIKALTLPGEAQARMTTDLADGTAVVTTAKPVSDRPPAVRAVLVEHRFRQPARPSVCSIPVSTAVRPSRRMPWAR